METRLNGPNSSLWLDMLFSILLDENGKDQGINVRQKVKEMVEFVQDDDRLREERKKAKKNKDKYIGVSSDSMGDFKQSNCKWSNVANLSVSKFESGWFLQPLVPLNGTATVYQKFSK